VPRVQQPRQLVNRGGQGIRRSGILMHRQTKDVAGKSVRRRMSRKVNLLREGVVQGHDAETRIVPLFLEPVSGTVTHQNRQRLRHFACAD
jgi:hypothetical protein